MKNKHDGFSIITSIFSKYLSGTNFFLRQVIFTNLILLILTMIAVLYFDKSIALFMHNHDLDQIKELRLITERFPLFLMILVIIVILVKSASKLVIKLIYSLYFYITLYLTIEIKTGLKVIFGRYWPKTWINNNLSLIHDNVFGFNFWHGFGNMGSFPSGHTTYVTFCTVWLIYLTPSKKNWFLVIWFLVPVSLIILDYHFLGDCLAGVVLGMNCAILSIYVKHRVIGIKNE